MNQTTSLSIKAIIGLGNPGPHYYYTRHNIGFRIVDALAAAHHLSWQKKDNAEVATLTFNNEKILLIKPQTFMNDSGKVIPALLKQGIKAENILVVHDELEQPFGALKLRIGGSARGHNGLKSIIAACGDQFARLRFGIARPEHKEDVPEYVLQKFKENPADVDRLIDQAVGMIEQLLANKKL
jgi:peptidyl-tRNA hydrolase, PTH1 family